MQKLDKLNLAETLDKESKGVMKTKEVKFAVEAIEMDEAVKNRFKDARIARAKNKLKDARIARAKNKLKDARIAKIESESKVEKLQWTHTMDRFQQNCRNCWKCD